MNTAATVGATIDGKNIMCGTTALVPKFANILGTGTVNTVVTGVSCKKIRVLSLMLMSTGANNAHISDTGCCPAFHIGNATVFLELTCSSGFTLPFSPVGWFATTAGDGLELNLSSASVDVTGAVVYVEV